MKYILVKAGERQPSAFSDLKELVNYQEGPQVGFFTLFKPGLRLVRNRTEDHRNCAFAIAHYIVNPHVSRQHPLYFQPLDAEMLMAAADKYEYVLAGIVTQTHLPSDEQVLTNIQYIARDADENLIDITTGLPLKNDASVTFFTGLFGFVRMCGLPIYHMIMNNDLIHATDGLDYVHTAQDTAWIQLSESDGTAAKHVFSINTSSNAHVVGSTIVTTGTQFRLTPFGEPRNVFRGANMADVLANSNFTVTGGLKYAVDGADLVIQTPYVGLVDVFELKFNCGHFFDIAHESERPTFRYVVIRSA
jgi:hypothetical protein